MIGLSLLVGLGIVAIGSFSNPTLAQLPPQSLEREARVTAIVPVYDAEGPTTPILIAPPNNSFVNTATPTFVWQASTDSSGISHYQLYLNGLLFLDNLPTVSTTTSAYTLVFDPVANTYSLTLTQTLDNANYTWKIRAYDTFDNWTDSATWNFTVDIFAPWFVINQIGDLAVSISAQDASTVPAEPIVLMDNRPRLIGRGEPLSEVVLTILIPGESSQTLTTQIDAAGNWSLELPLLPRGTVITLDFVITDQAGNVTILNNVQIMIFQDEIVIAPPIEEPEPIITIPVLPPEEIAHRIIKEIADYVPPTLWEATRFIPEALRRQIRDSAPYSGLLMLLTLPAAGFLAVASQFGSGLSLALIIRILQALGLLPKGRPQGMVFNRLTGKPIPFALLTVRSLDSSSGPLIQETVVTDLAGVYSGLRLPPGEYQLWASHQDYAFPSSQERPGYLKQADYYRGEPFTISSDRDELLFLIPMDPLKAEAGAGRRFNWRIRLAQLSRLGSRVILPLFVISGVLAILFPSLWNTLVFICYAVIISYQAIGWFRLPRISGTVTDSLGRHLEGAIIRLTNSEDTRLAGVVSSDEDGSFSYFGKPLNYTLTVSKPDYLWIAENGGPITSLEIDARVSRKSVEIMLTAAEQVDWSSWFEN